MTVQALREQRLHNQLITDPRFHEPDEVVRWMGAVQAQDYQGGLWAVGLRIPGATAETVEQAIARGEIVRTWPMRGTLHFVAPGDVRWMLKLMTPRVIAHNSGRLLRHLGLDEATFSRSRDLVAGAMQGGKQLPRNAVYRVLEEGGVPAGGQRGLHILWVLAQEGLICFAPRQGKQPAFALLDEWVPPGKTLERDEALAEIARRYFRGHGPATVQDFAWWSGLTLTDARAGLEMAGQHLTKEEVDGCTYWLSSTATAPTGSGTGTTVHLLPPYDEYTVGYSDRSTLLDPAHAGLPALIILGPTIVANGRIAGSWKRTLNSGSVDLSARLFDPLAGEEERGFAEAVERYGRFLGLPAALS